LQKEYLVYLGITGSLIFEGREKTEVFATFGAAYEGGHGTICGKGMLVIAARVLTLKNDVLDLRDSELQHLEIPPVCHLLSSMFYHLVLRAIAVISSVFLNSSRCDKTCLRSARIVFHRTSDLVGVN
jgi:hypothetical protein